MRKLIFPALLFSASMFAQKAYVSVSCNVDIKNAVVGSKPTGYSPALDASLNLHMVGNNGIELQFGYEHFQQIGFNRHFANMGYNSERYIPLGDNEFDFIAVPYVGLSLIHRFDKEDRQVGNDFIYGNSSHFAFQVGMSFRYKVSDKIMIDFTSELLTRPDLKYLYPTDPTPAAVISNSIGIHYILTN